MISIYEQGKGTGIGYTLETFSERFDEICKEHLRQGRARAFAFIFYNFNDREFKSVLRDQGVFTKLDRLSGSDLSIFYLHVGGRAAVEQFNTEFLSRLNLSEQLTRPLMVFFRLSHDRITNVAAVHLESASLIHGLHELHTVIADYIAGSISTRPTESKYWRWIKSGTVFVALEAFRAWLKAALTGFV